MQISTVVAGSSTIKIEVEEVSAGGVGVGGEEAGAGASVLTLPCTIFRHHRLTKKKLMFFFNDFKLTLHIFYFIVDIVLLLSAYFLLCFYI